MGSYHQESIRKYDMSAEHRGLLYQTSAILPRSSSGCYPGEGANDHSSSLTVTARIIMTDPKRPFDPRTDIGRPPPSGTTITSQTETFSLENLQRIYCIQYPGIVRNNVKAIKNLGGIQRIGEDLEDNRPLELKLDREQYYQRPSWSFKAKTAENSVNFMLKIRRRRKKTTTIVSHDEDSDSVAERTVSYSDERIDGQISGVVEEINEFRGFCDFQWLPIQTRRDRDEKAATETDENKDKDGNNELGEILDIPIDISTRAFPSTMADALNWFNPNTKPTMDANELLAVPMVFSRSGQPTPYMMVRDIDHKDAEIRRRKATTNEVGMSTRKVRKSQSYYLSGDEPEFPAEPTKEAVELAGTVSSPECHEALRALFEERPMWTRNAILYHTSLPDSIFKKLSGKFAFYLKSGPWGRLWCKLGYDPRLDPYAVKYQTVMVLFKHHSLIKSRNRLRIGPMGDFTGSSNTASSGVGAHRNNEISETSWCFKHGQLPEFRQLYLCITDIHLPLAREYELPSPLARAMATAHPVHGFLPDGATARIRATINASTRDTEQEIKRVLESKGDQEDVAIPVVANVGSNSGEGGSVHDESYKNQQQRLQTHEKPGPSRASKPSNRTSIASMSRTATNNETSANATPHSESREAMARSSSHDEEQEEEENDPETEYDGYDDPDDDDEAEYNDDEEE